MKCAACNKGLEDVAQLKAIEYLKKHGSNPKPFCSECFLKINPHLNNPKVKKNERKKPGF